jgi:SMODS domain-containing protein
VTVTEAFEIFKGSLELPVAHRQRASAAQQQLREILDRHLSIQDSFLTGSYARHTKIHPLNDIDVMLVRNAGRVGLTSGGVAPYQALDEIVGAARRAFPQGMAAKRQARSVNLSFQGLDFGFDLIPAWLRSPDGYWIPDADQGLWIPTDPQVHERLMTTENERSGGRLKPVIKMVKHWSRNNLDLLCSFHVELVCARVFREQRVESYQHGVALVLVSLPSVVGVPMMDPVYGQNRVDKPLSGADLEGMKSRVNLAAANAREAFQLEAAGRHNDAISKWGYIFLRGFPQ